MSCSEDRRHSMYQALPRIAKIVVENGGAPEATARWLGNAVLLLIAYALYCRAC